MALFSSTSDMSTLKRILVQLIVLVFVGALLYWLLQVHNKPAVDDALESAQEGSYADAIAEAQNILAQGGTPQERAQAMAIIEASMHLGTTTEGSLQAIRYAKEAFASLEGNDEGQALVMNRLVSYAHAAHNPVVLNEIFVG